MEANNPTMAERPPPGALLYPRTKTLMIYGANTDVGKTVVSALLCRFLQRDPLQAVHYLKPVSTGPATESDELYVRTHTHRCVTKTLYQWDEAVSPHIAARDSSPPSDDEVLYGIIEEAKSCDEARRRSAPDSEAWLFVETAGGVLSPGPSGTVQADLYRPLRLPVILVGDSKLGGISQTISAFESLRIRGYDVWAVVLIDFHPKYQNAAYLGKYFEQQHCVKVWKIPPPPSSDEEGIHAYYKQAEEDMFSDVGYMVSDLRVKHEARNEDITKTRATAIEKIWYPFTQHSTLSRDNIMAIDSAFGDHFQTAVFVEGADSDQLSETRSRGALQSSFDASASWWTQGLGHGDPHLALEAAYASGRYGHVIFPEAVHEPALSLAQILIRDIGNPRLERVFFSDNGSTGVEVAVKMALHATRLRYEWQDPGNLRILGLRDSYHGDTIGAMDCSEPSAFNQQIEWYTPRGVWLAYPEIFCSGGQWYIHIPHTIESIPQYTGPGLAKSRGPFSSLDAVLESDRPGQGEDRALYESYIVGVIDQSHQKGIRFGALMLEPVVLGAGGMHLVDPLFQRTLVELVRRRPDLFALNSSHEAQLDPESNIWRGLPVIFDEVFTGMYRLGRFTASSFLGVHPDISVHAKLLTGGLLPLCVTLASESIFNAFSGDHKSDALLHGHSYTAHPIGCHVALESLRNIRQLKRRGDWNWAGVPAATELEPIWTFWSSPFVEQLSNSQSVGGVWALGCVLAVHLKGETTGYTSTLAQRFQAALRSPAQGWNMHTRILGNVLYVMTSLITKKETMERVESLLLEVLENA